MATWVTETIYGDLAQVMLYPQGHGIARQMRAVADLAGLTPASDTMDMAQLPPEVCRVLVSPDEAQIELNGWGLEPTPYRPDWHQAATTHHQSVLIIGMDPWTGRDHDLDDYLTRAHRLRVGMVPVALTEDPDKRRQP